MKPLHPIFPLRFIKVFCPSNTTRSHFLSPFGVAYPENACALEGEEVSLIIPKPPVLQPEVSLGAYVRSKACSASPFFSPPFLSPSLPEHLLSSYYGSGSVSWCWIRAVWKHRGLSPSPCNLILLTLGLSGMVLLCYFSLVPRDPQPAFLLFAFVDLHLITCPNTQRSLHTPP